MNSKRAAEFSHFAHLLRINSKDRNNTNDTTTNFKVSIGPEVRQYNVSRIVLSQVNFPNFSYNINAHNKTLRLTTGTDGVVEYSNAEGQYTLSQLITSLETGFNALLTNNLTITQNANTQVLSFAIDGSDTIALSSVGTAPTSTMSPYLGILSDVGAGATAVGPSSVRLNGLTQVFIKSNRLAKQNLSSGDGQTRDYLTSIQIPVDFGQFVYHELRDSELASINYQRSRKLDSEIDIELLDQNEQSLDLQGYDVDLQFIIYYR